MVDSVFVRSDIGPNVHRYETRYRTDRFGYSSRAARFSRPTSPRVFLVTVSFGSSDQSTEFMRLPRQLLMIVLKEAGHPSAQYLTNFAVN